MDQDTLKTWSGFRRIQAQAHVDQYWGQCSDYRKRYQAIEGLISAPEASALSMDIKARELTDQAAKLNRRSEDLIARSIEMLDRLRPLIKSNRVLETFLNLDPLQTKQDCPEDIRRRILETAQD